MAMAEQLPHNPPKQTRSRRTLERIVRASLDILERDGPEGLTVHAIVEGAGSSVGSFYARFSGKDELLDYLGERIWREAAQRWDAAVASRDWAEMQLTELVQGSVRILSETGRSRSTYLKALERATGTRDDAYTAFQSHVLEGMANLLLVHEQEMDHPDPRLAVRLGLRAVLGVLDSAVSVDGELIPAQRRIEEASTLLTAYLLRTDGDDDAEREGEDFFDIWG